jgi:iron complex transport system substrate-binding protein
MTKYRGVLAAKAPRVYLACSNDGFVPCLEDESSGEQLKWLGGVNVAGTRATSPRRPRTIDEIRSLTPHAVVVAGGSGAAARLRSNPMWQSVAAVAAGRVYQYPGLPYSWGARPPSVNRLPGLIWLAYVLQERAFDAEFAADVRAVFRDFYHLDLTDQQLQKLLAQ